MTVQNGTAMPCFFAISCTSLKTLCFSSTETMQAQAEQIIALCLRSASLTSKSTILNESLSHFGHFALAMAFSCVKVLDSLNIGEGFLFCKKLANESDVREFSGSGGTIKKGQARDCLVAMRQLLTAAPKSSFLSSLKPSLPLPLPLAGLARRSSSAFDASARLFFTLTEARA